MPGLRVLIANNTLARRAGSELYVRHPADAAQRIDLGARARSARHKRSASGTLPNKRRSRRVAEPRSAASSLASRANSVR